MKPSIVCLDNCTGLSYGLWPRQRWNPRNRIPIVDHYIHAAVWRYIGTTGCSPLAKHTGTVLFPAWLTYWFNSPSPFKVAALFNPFIGLVLATFCGVTIPYPTMIKFWRSWIYQLDPYTRTLAAMVSTELQCVLPLTVNLSAKMSNVAAWSSAAEAMSLLCSTRLLGKRALRGVKIS
jgi:hypothetical protein